MGYRNTIIHLVLALFLCLPVTASQRLEAGPLGIAATTLDVQAEAAGQAVRWHVVSAPDGCRPVIERKRRARTAILLKGHGFYLFAAEIGEGASSFVRHLPVEVTYANAPVAAGLSEPFQMPAPRQGMVLNVVDFGATPDDPSDDDGVAFNAALQHAQAGEEIIIPAGRFHFQSTVTISQSHVALRGSGQDETKLVARLASNGSTRRLITVREGVTDLMLSDFTITRDEGELYYGIEIGRKNPTVGAHAVERIWLHRLRVVRFDARGLNLRTAKHVLISNCIVGKAIADLEDGGNGFGITLNNQSENNVIVHCAIGPQVRHGVLVQSGAHHNLIESNDVRGSLYDCYDLHAFESSSEPLELREHHNEFRFNVARRSTRAGFKIGNPSWRASGPGNWIHHNEVLKCERGIEVIEGSTQQVIQWNYLHHMQDNDDFGPGGVPEDRRYGIWLREGGGDDIIIRGNLIKQCRVGVGIDEGASPDIQWNRFRGNDIGIQTAPAPAVTDYQIRHNDLLHNDVAAELGTLPPAGGVYERNLD